MLAHDGSDSIRGLVGIVEGNAADVVVEDVGLDDTVEKMTTDETEFAIDGSSGATDEVPLLTSIVRESWVGVLEESNGD